MFLNKLIKISSRFLANLENMTEVDASCE